MNAGPLQNGACPAAAAGKPKLLVVELWGMGDLVIATPFLQAAVEKYEVTLLAKPYAVELQPRLWPGVKVATFNAPWTAFQHKYWFWRWPVRAMARLWGRLRREHFQHGVSSRWDPRDHALLKSLGIRHRLGFPRYHSGVFLTQELPKPDPVAHRYEFWRVAGAVLGLSLPTRENLPVTRRGTGRSVLVHTGARLAVRVWPLERYRVLVRRLREQGHLVRVICDLDQMTWWQQAGETGDICPRTVNALLAVLDQAGVFIGNDSGPGHLAAMVGLPTFTIFGPQLPEWFAPMHPLAEWVPGKSCPYKPCSDYCQLPTPECLWNVTTEEVWTCVNAFVARHLPPEA